MGSFNLGKFLKAAVDAVVELGFRVEADAPFPPWRR
jgi:hypothetical protein